MLLFGLFGYLFIAFEIHHEKMFADAAVSEVAEMLYRNEIARYQRQLEDYNKGERKVAPDPVQWRGMDDPNLHRSAEAKIQRAIAISNLSPASVLWRKGLLALVGAFLGTVSYRTCCFLSAITVKPTEYLFDSALGNWKRFVFYPFLASLIGGGIVGFFVLGFVTMSLLPSGQ